MIRLFSVSMATLLFLAGCTTTDHVVAQVEEMTAAEQRVLEIIEKPGIHVVHFWAPWCHNSIAELKSGYYEVIEQFADREDVTFTFVTIWTDGESGRHVLDRYAIPDHIEELLLPDFGPSDDHSQRRKSFLGLPISWTPSTWIYNRGGKLAFAYNYGELSAASLQELIESADSLWQH